MTPEQDVALTAASIILLATALIGLDAPHRRAERWVQLVGVVAALGLTIHAHGWAAGLARGPMLLGLGGMLAVVATTWWPATRRFPLRGVAVGVAALLLVVGWP